MKTNPLLLPGLAGLCLALAACGSKEPGEDSVATVDGYEITNSEIDHELAERGAADSQNPAVRRAALEAIINRKLLTAMAEENELDRTPDYILREQRMRELLLSQAAIESLSPQGARSDPEDVQDFLQNNLAQGRERTMFLVDGLQFPTPRDARVVDRLQAAKTIEQIRTVLSGEGIEAQSAQLTWDSAAMPSDLVRQINSLPASEPFLIPQDNLMVAGVVRDKRSVQLTAEQSRTLAESAVAQQTVRKRINDWLEQARFSAEIQYAEGSSPEGTGQAGEADAAEPKAAAAANRT